MGGKGLGKRKATGKGRSKGRGKTAAPMGSEFWENKLEEEGRKDVGSNVYQGVIQRYIGKLGYGFISPDSPDSMPKNVKAALAKQTAAAEEKGRSIEDGNLLYFRKPDVNHDEDFKLTPGTPCTFVVYVDNKGAGARDVSKL